MQPLHCRTGIGSNGVDLRRAGDVNPLIDTGGTHNSPAFILLPSFPCQSKHMPIETHANRLPP